MRVEQIPPIEAKPWILKRHYAHRMPCVQYAFGLFVDSDCVGVATFGTTSVNSAAVAICGDLWADKVFELNRLCVDANDDNACSFLVSHSIKLLPQPSLLVSYADSGAGHVGYIYQATNWIYTGVSRGDTEWTVDGQLLHRKGVYDRFGTSNRQHIEGLGHIVTLHKQGDKHRYVYFSGNKTERRAMQKALRYKVLTYPKGDTKHYDASAEIETQGVLF